MDFLADKLKQIQPSPTVALTGKVQDMKAAGKDIIGLSAGEPDFDTPDNIKDAAIRAIRDGKTKYTKVDGITELKEAIAEKFRRDNNLDYSLDEITVNCGGKQTIYNALVATLNPGDEVLIPKPYWVSYPDMVRLVGGTPAFVDCDPDNGFKLSPDALKAALTAKTKWFVFNTPSNPTGAVYTRDEVQALGKVLAAHGHVHILSDDIYEHIIYGNAAFHAIADAVPELKERTLTMNGVAKGYSMTGWRIGFGGGPKDLIRAMAKVQSQSTSNPTSISQWAAVEALTGPQDFIAERIAIFRERRDIVVEAMNDTPGLRCARPDGAFYVFVDVTDIIGRRAPDGTLIETDVDFAAHLLEAAGVAIVPGAAFGLSPYIRISYANATDLVREACSRIKKAVGKLT